MQTLTRELRTAVPAIVSDIMTIRFVKKAKTQKTMCVLAPNRALITWRNVLAPGALVLSMMDNMEKRTIWIVAPTKKTVANFGITIIQIDCKSPPAYQ